LPFAQPEGTARAQPFFRWLLNEPMKETEKCDRGIDGEDRGAEGLGGRQLSQERPDPDH